MKHGFGLNLTKTILLAGLAFWITLIAINNTTDPGTNIGLIGQMITMEGVRANPTMGNGLEWRAWPQSLAAPILVFVIVLQIIIAALLWYAAFRFAKHLFQTTESKTLMRSIQTANIGLAAFMSMWFFFLCGGLWFGYWMSMGAVQGVHFTLLMVSVLTLLLINHLPQTIRGEHPRGIHHQESKTLTNGTPKLPEGVSVIESQIPRKIVETFLEAFGRKDSLALLNLMSEDIRIEVSGKSHMASIGQYPGKKQAKIFLDILNVERETDFFKPQRIIATGKDVVVIGYLGFTANQTEEQFEGNFVMHFEINDDKIVAYRSLEDAQRVTVHQTTKTDNVTRYWENHNHQFFRNLGMEPSH